MKWKQFLIYFLCVSGIYLISFGVYLFLLEELLRAFISSDVILQPLRVVFLVLVDPVVTFSLSELFPLEVEGLVNPRFDDIPSIVEESEQQENL